MLARYFLIAFVVLNSCVTRVSNEYVCFYEHLNCDFSEMQMQESEFFLILLVDAKHLDYSNHLSFLNSLSKHPINHSKQGDVGHAWIYLQGWHLGKKICLEGGHSGERGLIQAKYFDGIMNYQIWGYANPTKEQKKYPRYEPNPVKYLWTTQADGYFEKGSGGHVPTFAAKINLTKEQFYAILKFIHPDHYPYHEYSLTQKQCSSFVTEVASLAGVNLTSKIRMNIAPAVWYNGCWIRFWEDPRYSQIRFSTPDILEKSLMEAVSEGAADYALDWYLRNLP